MDLGGMSNNGHVMPPHFLQEGLGIDPARLHQSAGGGSQALDSQCGTEEPYVLQQDSAPTHKAEPEPGVAVSEPP